jgi:hypothetical protein
MKVGETVRFRDRDYRVGPCRTDTGIELVELENKARGLWVCRAEVDTAAQTSQKQHKHVGLSSADSVCV